MRRAWIAAVLAVAAVVCVSACGSSRSSRSQSAVSPLSTALSYFPAGTPVVATLPTAANATSTAQLSQAPSATVVKAAAFQELAKLGIDYDRDVKPLFGNPIAFGIGSGFGSGSGSGSGSVGTGRTAFLVAWQTNSAAALSRLIGSVHGVTKAGTHDGASLYSLHGITVAVDGTQLLISGGTTTLDAALDRHAQGNGFTESDLTHDTAGLPTGDGVTVAGDLTTALSTPRDARARLVPWIAALGDYGATLTSAAHLTTLHFRVDTTGRSLSDSQLPIAAGPASPTLAATGLPVAGGLRDPAQLWTFITGALRTAAPAQYRKLQAKENLARRDGVDLTGLLSSLTGDLQLSSNGRLTYGREAVSPSTAQTIERLLARPPVGSGRSVALGGGLYRLSGSGRPLVAGVVNGTFVASNASAALTRAYARIGSTSVAGAQGSLLVRVALGSLLSMRPGFSDDPALPKLAAMLGDLTLSVQSSTQALTGSLSVGLR